MMTSGLLSMASASNWLNSRRNFKMFFSTSVLSASSVAAGTVTFNVSNGGTTDHEFVVLQTATAQNALPSDPANPSRALETGRAGKIESLAPRATGTLTLTLGSGSYVLICNNPAHYSALGMHTAFSVR